MINNIENKYSNLPGKGIQNLEDLKKSCEKIYQNFITKPSYSEIIKKYQSIFEEKIIGQNQAKKVMYDILEQIKANLVLREEGYNKPIASILFAGPSGVGKTKIARIMQKALNEFFNENNEIIKINCADFQGEQPFSLTRLIGASAGYIGSDRKPKFHPDNIKGKGRIILFDEIEKAGTPLKNILLSILDDGEIEVNYTTPSDKNKEKKVIPINGEEDNNEENSFIKASFKDKIIILTSNIGIQKLDESISKSPLGFTPTKKENINYNIEKIIKEELSNHFKLELQGRFNYIVPFVYFNRNDTQQLVKLQIENIIKQILNIHGVIVIFSDKVKNYITDIIISDNEFKKYGGRYIEHYFKKNLITPISQIINDKNIKNKFIYITENNGDIEFALIPVDKLD